MIFVAIPDLSKAGDEWSIGDTISLDTARADAVKWTRAGMRLRSCMGA